jgi:SAM-dependent methyltransferase
MNEGDWALADCLFGLYRRQLELGHDPYLAAHARPGCVRNQVKVFNWYRPWLPARGRVLDWGCAHGPDACLIRKSFGESLELHACDLAPPDRYAVFRDHARAEYRCLTHPVALPYPDGHFDAVVGSGVLEHVAFDADSLKEVWRVLQPGGRLIISYLPNRLSVQEFRLRTLGRPGFHHRLYGPGELRRMFLHHGFLPETPVRHQTFFWENLAERVLTPSRLTRAIGEAMRLALPLHVFASTLCCVVRKVPSF